MPGYHETTTAGSPQQLNGVACKGTPAADESMRSRAHSIALLSVLASACLLVLTPAIVAGISMVNPGALDQTSSWFQPLSSVTSHLDHAKLVLAAGAMVAAWSGPHADHVEDGT